MKSNAEAEMLLRFVYFRGKLAYSRKLWYTVIVDTVGWYALSFCLREEKAI